MPLERETIGKALSIIGTQNRAKTEDITPTNFSEVEIEELGTGYMFKEPFRTVLGRRTMLLRSFDQLRERVRLPTTQKSSVLSL